MTTGTVVKRDIIRSRGTNQRVVGKIVGEHYIESSKSSATKNFNSERWTCHKDNLPTRMRFELTRAEHNGLAVHRLNDSATSSFTAVGLQW